MRVITALLSQVDPEWNQLEGMGDEDIPF
jgi:hypothetical protein